MAAHAIRAAARNAIASRRYAPGIAHNHGTTASRDSTHGARMTNDAADAATDAARATNQDVERSNDDVRSSRPDVDSTNDDVTCTNDVGVVAIDRVKGSTSAVTDRRATATPMISNARP